MSRTLLLRKHIAAILGECAETYYAEAPDTAQFPYLCFELRLLREESGKYQYILEINAWNKENTVVLDEIMDTVEKKLNFYKHIDADIQFSIYIGSGRQLVEDVEKSIKRIREQFELHAYERSV